MARVGADGDRPAADDSEQPTDDPTDESLRARAARVLSTTAGRARERGGDAVQRADGAVRAAAQRAGLIDDPMDGQVSADPGAADSDREQAIREAQRRAAREDPSRATVAKRVATGVAAATPAAQIAARLRSGRSDPGDGTADPLEARSGTARVITDEFDRRQAQRAARANGPLDPTLDRVDQGVDRGLEAALGFDPDRPPGFELAEGFREFGDRGERRFYENVDSAVDFASQNPGEAALLAAASTGAAVEPTPVGEAVVATTLLGGGVLATDAAANAASDVDVSADDPEVEPAPRVEVREDAAGANRDLTLPSEGSTTRVEIGDEPTANQPEVAVPENGQVDQAGSEVAVPDDAEPGLSDAELEPTETGRPPEVEVPEETDVSPGTFQTIQPADVQVVERDLEDEQVETVEQDAADEAVAELDLTDYDETVAAVDETAAASADATDTDVAEQEVEQDDVAELDLREVERTEQVDDVEAVDQRQVEQTDQVDQREPVDVETVEVVDVTPDEAQATRRGTTTATDVEVAEPTRPTTAPAPAVEAPGVTDTPAEPVDPDPVDPPQPADPAADPPPEGGRRRRRRRPDVDVDPRVDDLADDDRDPFDRRFVYDVDVPTDTGVDLNLGADVDPDVDVDLDLEGL